MPTKSRIPARHTDMFWNAKTGETPHELVVVDRRERLRAHKQSGTDAYESYTKCAGASVDGWLQDDSRHTPEGVFAEEWLDVNPERHAIVAALREFARIDEAEWARRMLRTLEWIDTQTAE
jgi:hypothetical protein